MQSNPKKQYFVKYLIIIEILRLTVAVNLQ